METLILGVVIAVVAAFLWSSISGRDEPATDDVRGQLDQALVLLSEGSILWDITNDVFILRSPLCEDARRLGLGENRPADRLRVLDNRLELMLADDDWTEVGGDRYDRFVCRQ